MIELRTLGTLALRDSNGGDLNSVLAQPKRVALLAYLALARPRGFHRRDRLLALLWPEQDERHARWALNQALRHLRVALGKAALPSRGDGEVGIDPQALACDAVQFEAAIEADDLVRAVGLYRGNLLEGFHVSGCGDFERWLEEERAWLRRRAARAAAVLATRAEAAGEPAAAAHWARQALVFAPDDEGETRRLIELLGRLGDRAGAIQAYEEFARRLRTEYEVEPAPETLATITAVRERQLALETGPAAETRSQPCEAGRAAPGEPVASRARPVPMRHLRGMVLGLVVLGLITIGVVTRITLTSLIDPPASTLARTTVAVLPFTYRGDEDYAYLSEGMVDLLSANLDGAGDIRAVDPNAVLALVRQGARSRLEPGRVRNVAARLGAGSYVVGDIVEVGGRLRISARLQSSDGLEDKLQARVDGPPRQIFQLVDGLTGQLIAGLSGGPSERLSRLAALTTDSLTALKAYLEGERHFRAGRLDSATLALDHAIRIDSSFALAQYRMATTAFWTNRRPQAGEAVNRALRHSQRLGDRDRRLIEAFAASLHGRIADAERAYREIVTRYPNDFEATYQLGDLIFHRHGVLGRSWLDARGPLERVLSIDPNHQSALYHLSNIAAREGRLDELDSLTDRVLEIVPPPAWFFRGQRAVAFGDTAEQAAFVAALQQFSDDLAQPTAGFVTFTTGDLAVGRRLWRLLAEPSRARAVRVLAHVTLAKIEVMTGRWAAAKVELDAAHALDSATALEHRVLLSLWPHVPVLHEELLTLRHALLRWKATPDSSSQGSPSVGHEALHPYLRLYLLGLLSTRLRDNGPALDYAAELGELAEQSVAPAFVGDLARTLRAEVARAGGRPDEALAILESASFWGRGEDLELSGNSPFFEHEYEQFVRAELLYALGRHGESLQWYRAIADKRFHSGGPAHLRLAELYERQGERAMAAEHRKSFVELWKDCDPELRPLVDEAVRRMAR